MLLMGITVIFRPADSERRDESIKIKGGFTYV